MQELGRVPRLYVSDRLEGGAEVALARGQARYLLSVMRLRHGDRVRLFNGEDGEWLCEVAATSKKSASAKCLQLICKPTPLPDIQYVFAPLKSARLDYLAQKVTEMGACRLRPVFTDRTVPSKVNLERLKANVIEAAEQCNLVALPEVDDPKKLESLLAGWDAERRIIYCDEADADSDALEVLHGVSTGPLAILIGPEGGFSDAERQRLRGLEYVIPISLGPRIMRADTAGVAALALVQALHGDWRTDQRD
jgi:16S rRNA (uracil1498-N3)-methyltransferase